jgi:hypothetical protein
MSSAGDLPAEFGVGGAAICGGEPWPLAWLALAPFRLADADVADCFCETLEEAVIRVVRRA